MQRRMFRCSPWFTRGFRRLRAPALGFAALRPLRDRPCVYDGGRRCDGEWPEVRIRRRP
jgi:hypothetical protein